jgi:hypothetical protein
MKKAYAILTIVILFCATSFGQATLFSDNFDTYVAGQRVACQNTTMWSTWSNAPCGSEDPLVSNAQSFSSPNSIVITFNNDLISKLGTLNQSTTYIIDFMVYIPQNKAGYFNTLAVSPPASPNWAMQCYFNVGGTGTIDAAGASSASFSYPNGTWFPVRHQINLATDVAQLWINNVLIHTWPHSAGTFGGGSPMQIQANNFYGATANDEMYVDNYSVSDIIPVELTSFTASVNPSGHVVLNWSTATELNNRIFEIERRPVDGQFSTIGFIEGHGTTTEAHDYTYVDNNVTPGTYGYRLKQIDFNGTYEYFDEIMIDVTPPLEFALSQNYPNPFNPTTNIKYSITENSNVKLSVFNLLGQEVKVIVDGFQEAGFYDVSFDASDLPSGTYFYKIETAQFTQTKKMLLAK